MNLQDNIRRILKEIEEDKIQIRLGRSAERHFGKVQNIIIMVDDQDITSEDDVHGLGKMNIVIKDNEIIVGDIFIPEKYRKQGIATIVYQKISDYFNLPIVNSKTKGFNQTIEGGHIWKKRERFEPKNLQESIRRILREETERNYIFVRTDDFDNTGTIRKLPYDGIHCWCIYEDDFDKYIEELELWGGSRKKVRIVDGDNYKKYAINYKMTHDYVMGDSDEIPELENFNPNKHIMKFIKQGKKSMLSYVADIRYQIILL